MSKVIIILFVLLMSTNLYASYFTPPVYDPWYYEMEGVIDIPDKVAHYYRSYLGIKIIDWKLVALGNIFYEMHDSKRGVGYSWKDNIADFAGLISSKWVSSDKLFIYLDWSSRDKMIILKLIYSWE